MYSLVIDTAFETCQVGVWREDECLQTASVIGSGKHDVVLAPLVADVLKTCRLQVADLGRIIVTIGPGRFTGLRVGIAFARGLALVHGTPLVPVLTSEALRHDIARAGRAHGMALVIAVKRGESFVQLCDVPDAQLQQVMDGDFVATLEAHGITAVAGILSPELQALLGQSPGIDILHDIAEPSLTAIFAVGNKPVENKNKPIRPYYNA